MADEYLPPIKSDEEISNYNNPRQFMTGVESTKNIDLQAKDDSKKDDSKSDVEDDSKQNEKPPLANEWRQDHIPYLKEIMIISSFGNINNQRDGHYIPKLSPPPADDEQSTLVHWTRKELDMIQELYKQDPQCHLTTVCCEYPMFECSREYYLKKIEMFMKECKQPGACIWYTGHGEKDTGNWCFKDGVISFQDIFGLYMDHMRGRPLTIINDCSYSGKWVEDCVNIIDELGVPSCGHYTAKEGLLLKVYCACQEDQQAMGTTYVAEGAQFYNERYVTFWIKSKTFTGGQKPRGCSFVDIRCENKADMPCQVKPFYTWTDHVIKGSRLYIVRGKDRGRPAWHYVLVDKDKLESFNRQVKIGSLNVSNYGKILYSGFGQDPPEDIKQKISLQYS